MMAASVASPKAWTRGLPGYALAAILLVASAAFGLTFLFRGADDARTIWISAAVAVLSQIAAFPAVKRLVAYNVMAGWGVGTLVRFLTLGVYALIAGLVLHFPMAPALVSLVLFYFLSLVIESLFFCT